MRIFPFVRILLWLAPPVIFAWIVNQNLAPFGTMTMWCSATSCDPRIANFASKEKEILVGTSKETGEQYRVITVDPLYFDAKLFRPMKRATITLTYQNPDGASRLAVGVHGKGTGYEFVPLADHHPLISSLGEDWRVLREGGLLLAERVREGVQRFDSIDVFLRDLPEPKRIATYHMDLSANMRIAGYEPKTLPTLIGASVRGSHLLRTYVGPGEPLDFTFVFQDINRHPGKDDITVRVWRGVARVHEEVIPDDGVDRASGIASGQREFRLFLPDLPEGTYQIELAAATDDPFIRSILLREHLLAFEKRLYLAGNKEYEALGRVEEGALTVFVSGTKLSATTSHANALQTILVDGKRLALARVGEPVSVSLRAGKGPLAVTVPIRDVVLETDGVFAFSRDQFFAPPAEQVAILGTDPAELERYDYLIAQFREPHQEGKWLIAEQTIEDLPRGRTVSFLIVGDPPLGETKRRILVRELSVRLEGDPLTSANILSLARRFFEKLREGTL